MAQAITNKKSKTKKIRRSDYPYTVAQAVANGDIATRISFLILGFGSIVRKQFVKGFSYLVLEVLFIWFMIKHGASLLVDLFHINSTCLLYTSPSPRDGLLSRMPSSA